MRGIWQDVETRQHSQISGPAVAVLHQHAGATRLQENKVVQVACAEV